MFLAEDKRLGLVAVKVGEGEAGGDSINTEIGRAQCWGSSYLGAFCHVSVTMLMLKTERPRYVRAAGAAPEHPAAAGERRRGEDAGAGALPVRQLQARVEIDSIDNITVSTLLSGITSWPTSTGSRARWSPPPGSCWGLGTSAPPRIC